MNNNCELIIIEEYFEIKKNISNDWVITKILIFNPCLVRKQWCVYSLPSSGDLLVGIRNEYGQTGKILRDNNAKRHTQTIPSNNTLSKLFKFLVYITENSNGDFVMVEHFHGALVVTSSEGTYQFSYTWSTPSECRQWSGGVCTDALLHTHKVQMLSQNTQFLKYLLTGPSSRIYLPNCLTSKLTTSGSRSAINARFNKLSFFKHIYRNVSHFGMSDVIFIDSNTKITLFWNYSAINFKGTIIKQINGTICIIQY